MGTAHVKAVYEDMVAVLLSTLHPETERLDGSGGDGGRDVQLRHNDGRLDLFELKSFTGRRSKERGRRRQVEDSLKAAAGHNPDSWTLVVPIGHIKDELAWFDRLRSRCPSPLIWRGRTGLDQQIANHPAIAATASRTATVRPSASCGNSARSRPTWPTWPAGSPDAMERLRVLRERFDQGLPALSAGCLHGRRHDHHRRGSRKALAPGNAHPTTPADHPSAGVSGVVGSGCHVAITRTFERSRPALNSLG